MSGDTRRFCVIKLALIALVPVWIAACSRTVPVNPVFEQPPLFEAIQARVGSACAIPIHETHFFKNTDGMGVFEVDFDRASLTRFEQVFAALFSVVTSLPDWPPWRDNPTDLDGIIELDDAELTAIIGDDMGRSGEHVVVRYRVCLYEPDGYTVACWELQAEQHHQRQPFERNLDLNDYLSTLVETASREAIAEFMLAFEQDPAVRAWAQKVAARPGAIQ